MVIAPSSRRGGHLHATYEVFGLFIASAHVYARGGGRRVTIEEMAAAYRISRAHLMKVVNLLARAGYLTARRGRAHSNRLCR
jgi:DNA-binding IscR family transcriptional regulator